MRNRGANEVLCEHMENRYRFNMVGSEKTGRRIQRESRKMCLTK